MFSPLYFVLRLHGYANRLEYVPFILRYCQRTIRYIAVGNHEPQHVSHFVAPRLEEILVYFPPVRTSFSSNSYALASKYVSYLTRSEEHTSELQSRGHLVC